MQGYAPENYDEKFNGYVTIEYALEHSLNIPAVKSLKLLEKKNWFKNYLQCNFKQIQKDQRKLGLSMILGGCGTTLEELTGLFSALPMMEIIFRHLLLQDTDHVAEDIQLSVLRPHYMINEIFQK